MLVAITTGETIHGNPGERRILPAGILVMVFQADNLPDGRGIDYWVRPVNTGDVDPNLLVWANGPGVGLSESDLREFREVPDQPKSESQGVEFSEGRMENGLLIVTPVRTLKQSDMRECPHIIMMPDHYRDDGSCRCNDPDHTDMAEWGYVWDGAAWIAPDDDDDDGGE